MSTASSVKGLFLALMATMILCVGCSTHAKLTLGPDARVPDNVRSRQLASGQTEIKATIEDSDADYIYLETSNGKAAAVARNDIVDLDHPGYWVGVTGSIILGVGAAMTAFGTWAVLNTDCSDQPDGTDCGGLAGAVIAVGIIHIIPGIILTASGFVRHADSEAKASRGTQVGLAPLTVRDRDNNVQLGLGVVVRW